MLDTYLKYPLSHLSKLVSQMKVGLLEQGQYY